MPKPPSNDAKWCIEQLFQYIELNFKNRVAAKIGRARSSFDTVKLSNIGNYAAMAHPNKAVTPLCSSRWRQANIPIELSAQQRLRLRDVFIYYCGWAEKHNYLYMGRSQFLKMCRDCAIMGPRLTGVQLNLIFERIHLESKEPIPGVRLGLSDWLQALLRISAQLYRECSPQEAFDQLLEQHVLHHTPAAAVTARQEDRLAQVMLRQDLLEMLHAARARLRPIFKFYVNDQELLDLSGSGSGGGGGGGGGGAWKEVQEARSRMPFASFVRFAQDFELVPQMLTKAQLAEAFRCSRFGTTGAGAGAGTVGSFGSGNGGAGSRRSSEGGGPGASGAGPESDDLARIGFEEFVEAVGRLALTAYNYRDDKAEAPNIEFKQSYEAAAKQLWLDSSRKDFEAELKFPDEITMPAAMLEHSIGHDDRAHMDDVMSRAASKVFGRGRSSVPSRHHKVTQCPGLEVMAVHDEQPTLSVQDRPLHLTQFSADWVGRPGTPLTETAKLQRVKRATQRDQGWYSADSDLPPVFLERAQRMTEARVVREQVTEGMRLCYKAEQRRRQMDNLATTRALRQQLQAVAGQPLVAEAPMHQATGAIPSDPRLVSLGALNAMERSQSALELSERVMRMDALGGPLRAATATTSQSGSAAPSSSAGGWRRPAGGMAAAATATTTLPAVTTTLPPARATRAGRSQTLLEEIHGLVTGMAATGVGRP